MGHPSSQTLVCLFVGVSLLGCRRALRPPCVRLAVMSSEGLHLHVDGSVLCLSHSPYVHVPVRIPARAEHRLYLSNELATLNCADVSDEDLEEFSLIQTLGKDGTAKCMNSYTEALAT